jgi:hypothetical protein
MSFPTVKGMLIETEDETSNKPTANERGFFSGFAKAAIFRNDDALWFSFAVTETIRDHNEGFGVGDVGAGVLYARRDPRDSKRGVDCGAARRYWDPGWRRDLLTKDVRNVKAVRPQLANEFATGFSTRRPCMRSGSSSLSSSRVSGEGVVCEQSGWTFVSVGVNNQPARRCQRTHVTHNTTLLSCSSVADFVNLKGRSLRSG